MFAKYVEASNKVKHADAQKAELKPLEPEVQQRLEGCQKQGVEKRDAARTVYECWHAESAATLGATIHGAIRDGSISEKLKALVGEIETAFPPLLRIDWSAVDSQFMAQSAGALADDVLKTAIDRYVRPDLLAIQLKVAGEEQLSARLTSSISLMVEIAYGDAPPLASETSDSDSSMVMLMAVPPDKKISVIKALREVRAGLGLAEAKELVESTPTAVLEDATPAEAQRAKVRLEMAGAEVELL